jgi:hypothetical protein
MIEPIDLTGVLSYVAQRRKATGGYGATLRLPATIEDTFEAVAISRDLAILAPGTTLPHPPATDPELHGYLREAQHRTWPGLRTTCQLIRTSLFLGLPIDLERAQSYTASHRATNNDLHTAYYIALIDSAIRTTQPAQRPDLPAPLPSHPTVKEVRMHLTLRKLAGDEQPADHDELLAWLHRCQNGDGGFGFFPCTTSFIENSHHALAALTMLGAAPKQPEGARQFVLSCQTGRGGFGRGLRAAPFLDSSWHALASLRLLS